MPFSSGPALARGHGRAGQRPARAAQHRGSIVKPLYIVGTERHVGKTTLCLGLVHGFLQRGLRTAYLKPLGQHFSKDEGGVFHDDARVVAQVLNSAADTMGMVVPLGRGQVEKDIKTPRSKELLEQIEQDVARLGKDHDVIVLEGMGNVAMGACLNLSAADVARHIGARSLLVVGAGIGRTVDEAILCSRFIRTSHADLMGVVVSKAWPTKYDRIAAALNKSLPARGIDVFGIVPYQEELACPTVGQVFTELEGELLGGEGHLDHRITSTIIGAMQAENMSRYVTGRTLIITPGDRTDVIMACLRAHLIGGVDSLSVSGLVLTCGHRPDEVALKHIRECHLPTKFVEGDTYSVATALRNRVYKITPTDHERIDWAVRLASQYIDLDRIIAGLKA